MLNTSSMDPDTDKSSLSSRTSTTSLNGSSQSTSTSISESEDQVLPLLPAWQVLEATPIAIEALLTACANGRLSSRQLTTGLIQCSPSMFSLSVFLFFFKLGKGYQVCLSLSKLCVPKM